MTRLLTVALAAMGACSCAFADPISGGTLVNFPGTAGTGTAGVQGSPFWNGFSMDGANKNVGFFITNSGGFVGGSLAAPTKELTDGTSNPVNAATNFDFVRNAESLQLTLLGAFSNFATTAAGTPFDVVGWYETDAMGSPGTKHQLYAGGSEASQIGMTIAFNPTAFYGFYLTTCIALQGSNCLATATFYTNSNFNSVTEFSDAGQVTTVLHQHFAAFGANALTANHEAYYIGIEDSANTFGTERYGDFNDVVFSITEAAAPEPSTAVFMIGGLALFVLVKLASRPA